MATHSLRFHGFTYCLWLLRLSFGYRCLCLPPPVLCLSLPPPVLAFAVAMARFMALIGEVAERERLLACGLRDMSSLLFLEDHMLRVKEGMPAGQFRDWWGQATAEVRRTLGVLAGWLAYDNIHRLSALRALEAAWVGHFHGPVLLPPGYYCLWLGCEWGCWHVAEAGVYYFPAPGDMFRV